MGKYLFDEIFTDCTKQGTKIKTGDYLINGAYPIIDQGKEQVSGYTNSNVGLFTDVPAIIFGDHTRIVKYVNEPFFLGADGVKLLKSKKLGVDYKYIYYALKHTKIPDTGYNRHFKWLKEVKIPLPPLEVQQEIAKVLDLAAELTELHKKRLAELDTLIQSVFYDMFGDPVLNEKGWIYKNLSSLIVHANNGMARRGNDEDGNVVLRLVELQRGYLDYTAPNRITLNDSEINRYLLQNNDFLFARVNGNPENVGRCAAFYDVGEPVFHNDHIIRVRFDRKVVNTYVSILLNGLYGIREMKNKIKTSAGQYTINQEGIGLISIPLPPLPLQQAFANIVEKIEAEKTLARKAIEESQYLFDSLMAGYFE